MIIDPHHIVKQQYFDKGRPLAGYKEYMDHPFNLIRIQRDWHSNIHANSTNKKGIEARKELHEKLNNRLYSIEFDRYNLLFAEKQIITKVYYWCTIECWDKTKKDPEILKKYGEILKKYS